MRALLLIFMVLTGIFGSAPSMARESPWLDYDLDQTIRTPTDHRERRISFSVTPDKYLGMSYRYEEYVSGSIDPVVREVRFSNLYDLRTTPEQRAVFFKALHDAGFFQTASDPEPENYEYEESIEVTYERVVKKVAFYSPASFPMRSAVRQVVFDFAHAMKVDQPSDPQAAVIVSEGDRQPPRRIGLSDILAHADEYNGKRVSIAGYFHGEFEGMTFCSDKDSVLGDRYEKCVWLGSSSSFADAKDISKCNDCWLQVEGVFFKGPAGHMSLWPGEITRLTRTEAISSQK